MPRYAVFLKSDFIVDAQYYNHKASPDFLFEDGTIDWEELHTDGNALIDIESDMLIEIVNADSSELACLYVTETDQFSMIQLYALELV